MRRLPLILITLIGLSPVLMADYPQPKHNFVNDFANVINEPDQQAITQLFEQLDKQTGVQAVAVTISSITDYNTGDLSIEEFATGLFNKWGIGSKKANNGILVLVAVKDHDCRIELGKGYGRHYDAAMQEVINSSMLPYFRTDDYSRGTYEGCRGAMDAVTKKVSWLNFYKWHIVIGILIAACVLAGINCIKNGKTGWGWAFFVAAGVLLLLLLKMIASGRSSRSGGGSFGGGSSFGGGASGSW